MRFYVFHFYIFLQMYLWQSSVSFEKFYDLFCWLEVNHTELSFMAKTNKRYTPLALSITYFREVSNYLKFCIQSRHPLFRDLLISLYILNVLLKLTIIIHFYAWSSYTCWISFFCQLFGERVKILSISILYPSFSGCNVCSGLFCIHPLRLLAQWLAYTPIPFRTLVSSPRYYLFIPSISSLRKHVSFNICFLLDKTVQLVHFSPLHNNFLIHNLRFHFHKCFSAHFQKDIILFSLVDRSEELKNISKKNLN